MPDRRILAAVAAIGLAGAARGALPPAYERAKELRDVIEASAPRMPAPIDRVEAAGVDTFRVTAGRCTATAKIVDAPTDRAFAGPRRYRVVVTPVRC